MSETAPGQNVARKSRSPRYPGVSLDVALQRAHALYEQEKRHWAPIDTIQAHWGYKPRTGPANVSISALKQFGLIEDEGANENRRARLTQLALEIILSPDKPDRFIRQAALMPEIHRDLWAHFEGSLPSDPTLKRLLIIDRTFTEGGAQEFISQFRKTIAFARLSEALVDEGALPPRAASMREEPEPARPEPGELEPQSRGAYLPPVTLPPAGQHSFPIPLMGGKIVQISGDFPITETAWRQMIRILEVFKPGLVTPDSEASH